MAVEDKFTPMMFVTANVGSIFEDPEVLLKVWVKEFLSTVKQIQPQFLALHCQEVGGKNYEESMRHVEDFVRTLMASEELMNFNHVRVFLDEDFTCTEKFTALGNLYFIHNSVKNVQIWDFHDLTFVSGTGKEIHSGNIEKVTTKEKAKFPQDFFPECKWSRKGFMRTRWNLNGTIFDLINIHLFHDASNFIAMESFPSSYSKNRQHALEHLLNRLKNDEYEKVPFFMFGDFNFRLDTKGVVQKLTNKTTPIHIKSAKNGEIVKMLFRDPVNENRVVLTLEKKVFDLENHEETFFKNHGKWLRDFDKESLSFQEQLYEFDIEFPPSYPFREDGSGANCYMKTRCPSWCDRILLSKGARDLIYNNPDDPDNSKVLYQLIGANTAMGDHKPVLLWFRLLPATGTTSLKATPTSSPMTEKVPTRRTRSNPPEHIWLHDRHMPTRRTVSLANCTHKPKDEIPYRHSVEELFLMVQQEQDEESLDAHHRASRQSSRLLSHHSSSSEDWYTDLPNMPVHPKATDHSSVRSTRELITPPDSPLETCKQSDTVVVIGSDVPSTDLDPLRKNSNQSTCDASKGTISSDKMVATLAVISKDMSTPNKLDGKNVLAVHASMTSSDSCPPAHREKKSCPICSCILL